MAWLQFPAFAVFFACCIGQFWVIGRVRNALIDRHPDLYLEIQRSSIFPQRRLQKFIRSGQHRELKDEQLSKAVMQCRWLFGLALASWLVLAAGIIA
ncbi:MAG: hypothetical protein ACKOPE_06740 [Novosphingobium sp.]